MQDEYLAEQKIQPFVQSDYILDWRPIFKQVRKLEWMDFWVSVAFIVVFFSVLVFAIEILEWLK